MEQIYTIPVNEAFEECMEKGGCPFCALSEKLEKDEIDLILGASMMEPDIRKKTNEMGFCKNHFKNLLAGSKKLPLALIMESHLAEVDSLLSKPGIMPAAAGAARPAMYCRLEAMPSSRAPVRRTIPSSICRKSPRVRIMPQGSDKTSDAPAAIQPVRRSPRAHRWFCRFPAA